MKIGKISINAANMVAKGKGKFSEWAKKSPVTEPIMRNRTGEQKQAWIDSAWNAIQSEVNKGAKSKGDK